MAENAARAETTSEASLQPVVVKKYANRRLYNTESSSYVTLEDLANVLRKLGRGSRAVSGRLVRAPRKGSVVVIEFPDGMHEYVTTPVKRVLRLASRDVFYIETVNSRYRLEVRDRERALDDASSG